MEKIFNDEEISVTTLKSLPTVLQDDFLEFTAYLREKIIEIKNSNEISFIMAEVGDSPSLLEDISLDLPNFLELKSS